MLIQNSNKDLKTLFAKQESNHRFKNLTNESKIKSIRKTLIKLVQN
jgi:hypothetical protein